MRCPPVIDVRRILKDVVDFAIGMSPYADVDLPLTYGRVKRTPRFFLPRRPRLQCTTRALAGSFKLSDLASVLPRRVMID